MTALSVHLSVHAAVFLGRRLPEPVFRQNLHVGFVDYDVMFDECGNTLLDLLRLEHGDANVGAMFRATDDAEWVVADSLRSTAEEQPPYYVTECVWFGSSHLWHVVADPHRECWIVGTTRPFTLPDSDGLRWLDPRFIMTNGRRAEIEPSKSARALLRNYPNLLRQVMAPTRRDRIRSILMLLRPVSSGLSAAPFESPVDLLRELRKHIEHPALWSVPADVIVRFDETLAALSLAPSLNDRNLWAPNLLEQRDRVTACVFLENHDSIVDVLAAIEEVLPDPPDPDEGGPHRRDLS